MKQAILLLLHKDFEQAITLISFFEGQCEIYIHIDKSANIDDNTIMKLKNMSGVKGVYRKYNVHWAGFSILKAEIFLLRKALENGNAGYFHLLSGQDYPIRPLNDFIAFFSHTSSWGYIHCNRMPCDVTDNATYYRMQHFVMADYINTKTVEGKRRVWAFVDWQRHHGIKRRIPDYVDYLYAGSAWFSLSRVIAQYLVDYTRRKPAFFKRMRFTYIPEEIYVSSVILNSPYKENIVWKNNCRTILWQNEGIDCSPINIHKEDFCNLLCNPQGFFSRKFEQPESQSVIEMIDKYLLQKHDYAIADNGGWITEWLDGYEFDFGLYWNLKEFCRTFGVKTVCDFGCGPGWYVRKFRDDGISAVGYDYNPYTEKLSMLFNGGINDHCCGVADLTESVQAQEKFDVVLFLSVGQYIPQEYEKIVFDNLKRNASKYVIITWAGKKEEGKGYVNKLSEEEIVSRMCAEHDFVYNKVATLRLREECMIEKNRKTVLVFQKV